MKSSTFYSLSMVAAVSLFMVTAQAEVDPAQAESSGTVVATENAGAYTYVQIDFEGGKVWYAAPASTFALGEKVFIPSDGLPMKDFYSETLDRTFDMVYFVGAITKVNVPKEEALPPGHPPINGETPSETAPVNLDFSGIEKPPGGKTIAEIHQDAAALAGKNVIVRGKVVKVSNNILGKNWIHLQDGTGDASSNDLTVTTKASVEVGATVTVSGVIATNRDFGSGYKYAVLLEEATIQTQ